MSDFMIRNNSAFFGTEYTVLFGLAGNNHFHGFKKIRLRYCITSITNSQQCCFIDNIGQVRANGSACCQCNLFKINGFIHTDILRMHLQNINTPFEIRTLYDNTAVKTSRSEKCLIKDLRAVRCRKNDNSLG